MHQLSRNHTSLFLNGRSRGSVVTIMHSCFKPVKLCCFIIVLFSLLSSARLEPAPTKGESVEAGVPQGLAAAASAQNASGDEDLPLQSKLIAKIEYRIDTRPVSAPDRLNALEKQTLVREGEPFSRYDVQRSVVSLYASEQFSQVNVYALDTPEGVVLTFELKSVKRIKKINFLGAPEELRRAIENAIKSKPGDVYVPAIAKNDANRIKAACADYGFFSTEVIVSPEDGAMTEEGEFTYKITLGAPAVITELQIQGHLSISTQQIKGACQLVRAGEIYRTSDVESDIALIRALYRKNNYPTATIEFTFAHQTGVLTFHVEEGRQFLIDFLSEGGKLLVSRTLIRNLLTKLRVVREDYKVDELRNQITQFINAPFIWKQTVQAHFKERGYDGTTVQWGVLVDTPLRYHVRFTINPGPRYVVTRVTFSGNRAFSNEELLREMKTKPPNGFFQRLRKRFFYEQTLGTDLQSLKILYEKAGYPNAHVEVLHLEKRNSNNRGVGEMVIYISIVEEHKEVIHRCRFSGNWALDAATLLDVLPSQPPQPNAPLVRKAYENAILKAYQSHGYIDASVNAQYLPRTGTPVFQVEGNFAEQLKVGTLSTELPAKLQGEFERYSLTLIGTVIATEIEIEIGRRWIIQDAQGDARYTLEQEVEHLAVFEHGVLDFEIAEGEQFMFGKIHFAGDPGVKQYVLTREVAHLQGTLFTPTKLSRVVQNFYSSGVFEPGIYWERLDSADIESRPNDTPIGGVSNPPPISNRGVDLNTTTSDTPKVNDISIRLQKQKPGAASPSVGYSSSDGLRGTLALSHRNLFERNIRFRLRGRAGFRGGTLGYLYDATLTEPWLFARTRGSLQYSERDLEEDDNVRARQASFTLSRALPRSHLLDLQYSYRDLHDTPQVLSDTKPPTVFKTTVSSLRFSWTHDSRRPYINPTSGMLNEVKLEYAGGFLGGESSFIKTVADTRYYRKLSDTEVVLATALRFGIITGIRLNRTAELSSFERFWAGGSTTVRGYAERALGPLDSTGKHRGNVQLIFNTELRFPIYNPIHGVFFFDTGNVWGKVQDIDYAWLPAAVGAGFRLNLPPLTGGFDYAVALVSVPGVPKNFWYLRVGSTF